MRRERERERERERNSQIREPTKGETQQKTSITIKSVTNSNCYNRQAEEIYYLIIIMIEYKSMVFTILGGSLPYANDRNYMTAYVIKTFFMVFLYILS